MTIKHINLTQNEIDIIRNAEALIPESDAKKIIAAFTELIMVQAQRSIGNLKNHPNNNSELIKAKYLE